jgi:hypothetical protein
MVYVFTLPVDHMVELQNLLGHLTGTTDKNHRKPQAA